ncbi:hypothetical protein PPS11_02376 [Pseudomonas putida S11]|nr:hypothetical protein PPS11_02376 [Pseudomonas putida S11]
MIWICFWFFLASLALLLLLEEVLAVVHHLADGRLRVGGDFHQIQLRFISDTKRFINRDDANLLAVSAN